MSKYVFNGVNTLSVIENSADSEMCGKCASYRVDEAEQKVFSGVFEGSDGYGEVIYPEYDNHSGAYIGSRIAASAAINWFSSDRCQFDDNDAERLRSCIDIFMRRAKRDLDYEGRPLFKKKARTFPSSAAVCAVDCASDDSVNCEFLWVGNCRGYVLDACGLCQITDDDISGAQDAYNQRAVGAKLNNVINADIGYTINFRRIKITEPMLLITATTAAFDDFDSPMEFEYAILYALIKSKSVAEWEKRLGSIIREYAGDDFSMTVMSVGFTDFNHMRSYYEPRIKHIIDRYIRPLNAARKGEARVNVGALWNQYKNDYYR